MIIRKLHIENFGHFHDFTLELPGGLTRLRRENEFGKSTLLEFIRRVLWGYPDGRRTQLNRYPARFNAGEYGGSLEVVLADGGQVTFERYGARGALVARRPDGREEPGDALLRRLTPVSEECYRNVYAVTVDELTELSSLDGEEIRGRLYGGAITGGDISLPALGKHLDERAKALFKARSQATLTGAARRELRAAVEKRDRVRSDLARRPALERELAELEERSRELRAAAAKHADAVARSELLLKAHPRYLELARTERELAALPEAPEVPPGAVLRAEELARRLAEATAALPPDAAADAPQSELLAAAVALADRELAGAVAPDAPTPTEADLACAGELESRAARLDRPVELAPKTLAALLVCTALALCASAGLWMYSPTAGAIALFAGVVVTGGAWAAALLALRRRRELARAEREELEADRREFRTRCGLLCPPEKFSATLAALRERRTKAAELDRVRKSQAARAAVAQLRAELAALCASYRSADPEELRRGAELTARRNTLRSRRAELAAAFDAVIGDAPRETFDRFDPDAERLRLDAARKRNAEAEQAVLELHRRAGELANELRHLPRGEELELADSEVEQARGALRRLVRDYLVVRGCRTLLDAAVERYERESQPEVLKRAAALFADFTGGRYPRVYKSVASGELVACDARTGLEKSFAALSRGTREELMLAMRLALIECTERDSEPLPVCFDDVGVNFDPARLARVEAAVEKFARGRQVIWFSHS